MKQKNSLLKTLLLLFLLPFIVLAVKKIVDIRKGAAGTPANIVVDSTSLQGNIPSSLWQNIAQGGEEPKDMIRPVANQLRQLSPELIRLDHLYDYFEVYKGPNNFDFSKLDQTVDSILMTGAKPMLAISYTPPQLSSGGNIAGAPTDWNQWYALVKATAYHYSVEKKISGIYYEVWNEPDLFGGWHYGKEPSYSTLFAKTSAAIRDGARGTNYKVGGPATTAYYANWIKALFKFCHQNKLPLDFISWHKYTKNMEDFERDFETFNDIIADYPEYFDIERVITETGPNPEPDPWYDSSLSGVHLISQSTRLAGRIHRIFTFEAVDGPTSRSSNSAGWGMITHPTKGQKEKPRYYAIQFLNNLKGQRLTSIGDGSWVTSLASKSGDITQVLLVNYDPRGAHTEAVPVTINHLPAGSYTLKTQYFLGTTTNLKVTVDESSTLKTQIYLDPNTAVLISLTPIK